LNFDQRFGGREMQRVNDVFAAFPFERVTLHATHGKKVDIPALNRFMDFLKTSKTDVELDLALPKDMLPTAMRIVANHVPCVSKVGYEYSKDLETADFNMYASHIIGRRSLVQTLLSALDDSAHGRISSQRRLGMN